MSTDFMQLHRPGIGNASSYQVSGKPFVTGNLSIAAVGNTPTQVSFPSITKKVIIINPDTRDVRVGFSSAGVSGSNFVLVNQKNGSEHGHLELEVKCTSIFLLGVGGTATVNVAAELTNIPALELPTNWSGSVGVG